MSHHETPQKRERLQKLQNLYSPLTPLSLLPLSISPFGNKHKKESKAKAERKDPAVR
jgi:hypothetical protein